MSKKAKSVTKAWALKDKASGELTRSLNDSSRPALYSSRAGARSGSRLRLGNPTPIRVRVTVEEASK